MPTQHSKATTLSQWFVIPRKKLPEVGSAYAMPQKDGRFGACRVIRRRTAEEIEYWNRDGMLIAVCSWFGDATSDLDLAGLQPLLRPTSYGRTNQLCLLWIEDPPPTDFVFLGIVPQLVEEQGWDYPGYGVWNSIRFCPLREWQWEHDREALLAEDEARAEAQREEQEKEQQAEKERLANMTLEKLAKRRFFPDWYDYPPEKAKRASRKIMRETARELLELGKETTKRKKKAVLKKCIERFNELDEAMDHFIETDEAEAIVFEFDVLVQVSGVNEQDLADQWRDW